MSFSGVRKRREKFEVWIKRNGDKVVVGSYASRELAEAIKWISGLIAADYCLGPKEEVDVILEWINISEMLGVHDRLREITGWELDHDKAWKNEKLVEEKHIQQKIDLAIRLRKDKAAAVRDYRALRSLQFVTVCENEYPPIPTMSALATEDAFDLPEQSGVYFVWCPDERLQYVGQAVNLRGRASLKHERINIGDRVSWLLFPLTELYFTESYYIGIGRPLLNFGRLQENHRARMERSMSDA